MAEYGRLIINDTIARDFTCDCRSHIDIDIVLPGCDEWLGAARLHEIASAAAAEHGVTFV